MDDSRAWLEARRKPDEAVLAVAAAMRERFPMLDPMKSFELARIAIAALKSHEGTRDADQ